MASSLYEILYIIDSSLPEADVKALENEVKSAIQSRGGEIKKESQWGERKLAYEIRKKTHGYYFNYEFKAEENVPTEVRELIQTRSAILRHLMIKVPKAKLLQEKQEEEKKRKELEAAQREREKVLAAQKAQEEKEAEEAAAEAAVSTEVSTPDEEGEASTSSDATPKEEPVRTEESVSAPAEPIPESTSETEKTESEESEEPRNE